MTSIDCGPCTVRSWRRDDHPALVRFAGNRKIWLNLRDRFPHPYTDAHAAAFLDGAIAAQPETVFAIDVGGEAVGGVGVIPGVDVERVAAELGYWVAEPFWGRGVATAAVRGVTGHAFQTLGLLRLFALPFADNLASRRVLEKAGYQLECVMRRSAIKNGVVKDQALYAFLSSELLSYE